MGDSVMASFENSADAVRTAIDIQKDINSFNADRKVRDLVLKLGLHSGPCIAVTNSGFLDYFGTTVNTAARLQPSTDHRIDGVKRVEIVTRR